MKTLTYFLLLLCLLTCNNALHAQVNTTYDSLLAKKLQADDYGMKSYVLIILTKGSANITDKQTLDSIFKGHMTNIKRLATENKLLLAGPIGENEKDYEGIFVFNTSNINEAKEWLDTDPAIQSKHLDAELYAWYGPAALQEVVRINKTLSKKSF